MEPIFFGLLTVYVLVSLYAFHRMITAAETIERWDNEPEEVESEDTQPGIHLVGKE